MWTGVGSSIVQKLPSNVSLVLLQTILTTFNGGDKSSLVKDFIIGGISGGLCALPIHSLYVIASFTDQRFRYSSYPVHLYECSRLLVKQYGYKVLFRHSILSICQMGMFGAVYFGMKPIVSNFVFADYSLLKLPYNLVMKHTNLLPIVFVTYPVTIMATISSYPFFVLKHQMLFNFMGKSTSSYVVAYQMWDREGFAGFMKGLPFELVESLSFTFFVHFIERFTGLVSRFIVPEKSLEERGHKSVDES